MHTHAHTLRPSIYPSSVLCTARTLGSNNRKYARLGHSISWLLEENSCTIHTRAHTQTQVHGASRFSIEEIALQHSTQCVIRELVSNWIKRETCCAPDPKSVSSTKIVRATLPATERPATSNRHTGNEKRRKSARAHKKVLLLERILLCVKASR